MGKRFASAAVLLTLLVAVSCQTGPEGAERPRFPDDQGVVTQIDFETLKLDGKRSYKISPEVESFSTYNLKITPLLSWDQRYVHLGLDDDVVVWIAGIGNVLKRPAGDVVVYTGARFLRIDRKRNAIFFDGTVIKIAEGVEVPPEDTITKVTIDPAKHAAIDLLWEGKQLDQ